MPNNDPSATDTVPDTNSEKPLQNRRKDNLVRRLYDWVLHWSDTRFGAPALFLLAFVESSVFIVPPDVLLIALSMGKPRRAFYFAAVCTLGSVLGGILGYYIGALLWDQVSAFFFKYIPGFTVDGFDYVSVLYHKYGFWAVFTAGFTPIPYKIFTITSGVFGIDFVVFMVASAIGRGARFVLVAGLIWKFGAGIKQFIDRYFNLLSVLFVVLLVLGFVLIKYII